MGGNAIKNSKRISNSEIQKLKDNIVFNIRNFKFSSCIQYIGFPKTYENKEDHGDLDTVISLYDLNFYKNEHFKKEILSIFSSKDYFFNSNVFSIEFLGYQIDLIFCSSEFFNSHLSYLSYNDLGNFIGRTAHKMGLKFGEKGLLLPVRLNSNVEEMILSSDFEQIIEFLGYDVKVYKQGFKTLEEIFEFTVNSRYFSGSSFIDSEQNHTNRVRNSKRKTWNTFCSYLKENSLLDKNFNFPDKEISQKSALEFFNKVSEYNYLLQENEKRNLEAEKFNGNIVKDLTSLKEKSLGIFIKRFKEKYNISDFSKDEIKELIKQEAKAFET